MHINFFKHVQGIFKEYEDLIGQREWKFFLANLLQLANRLWVRDQRVNRLRKVKSFRKVFAGGSEFFFILIGGKVTLFVGGYVIGYSRKYPNRGSWGYGGLWLIKNNVGFLGVIKKKSSGISRVLVSGLKTSEGCAVCNTILWSF